MHAREESRGNVEAVHVVFKPEDAVYFSNHNEIMWSLLYYTLS